MWESCSNDWMEGLTAMQALSSGTWDYCHNSHTNTGTPVSEPPLHWHFLAVTLPWLHNDQQGHICPSYLGDAVC